MWPRLQTNCVLTKDALEVSVGFGGGYVRRQDDDETFVAIHEDLLPISPDGDEEAGDIREKLPVNSVGGNDAV
jgi:hypothetical protein